MQRGSSGHAAEADSPPRGGLLGCRGGQTVEQHSPRRGRPNRLGPPWGQEVAAQRLSKPERCASGLGGGAAAPCGAARVCSRGARSTRRHVRRRSAFGRRRARLRILHRPAEDSDRAVVASHVSGFFRAGLGRGVNSLTLTSSGTAKTRDATPKLAGQARLARYAGGNRGCSGRSTGDRLVPGLVQSAATSRSGGRRTRTRRRICGSAARAAGRDAGAASRAAGWVPAASKRMFGRGEGKFGRQRNRPQSL